VILKERTAFSNKKSGSVGFSGKLAEASLSGDSEKRGEASKNFVIEVSFYDKES